jgi:hypothetical protein
MEVWRQVMAKAHLSFGQVNKKQNDNVQELYI